jgi:environmental stress-induced protein Ves
VRAGRRSGILFSMHDNDPVLLPPGGGRSVAWKNGRGVTRELWVWPPEARFEAGDFDWRVSIAGVTADGPFSSFPEHERLLLISVGSGLELDHGPAAPRARLRPLEPYRFDGAWPTSARLLGGAITDFGVLTRRGAIAAELEVLPLARRRWRLEAAPAEAACLYALRGSARARLARAEQPFELAQDAALLLPPTSRGFELDAEGRADDTRLIVLRLWPTS